MIRHRIRFSLALIAGSTLLGALGCNGQASVAPSYGKGYLSERFVGRVVSASTGGAVPLAGLRVIPERPSSTDTGDGFISWLRYAVQLDSTGRIRIRAARSTPLSFVPPTPDTVSVRLFAVNGSDTSASKVFTVRMVPVGDDTLSLADVAAGDFLLP